MHDYRSKGLLVYLKDLNYDAAGRPGLFAGVMTTPAAPGEPLQLFGGGFGPTMPAVPAGEAFEGAAPLVDDVDLRIGGEPANVLFAGLSAAGLYQLNVVVPELPAGEHAVTATVAGVTNLTGVKLAVAQH